MNINCTSEINSIEIQKGQKIPKNMNIKAEGME